MITNKIVDYIKATKYNIGFVEQDLNSIIEGKPITVNWLKHSYKDRWFADPFILDVTDDEIIVLVEEWYDPIQRGRISKIRVNKRTYELTELKVMIDEGSHLSFPAITRRSDGIFIQPESSVTGQLIEYKYDENSDSFEKKDIISDLPLTDSVRTGLFGSDLLFSTKMPDANGKDLGIYEWDESNRKYRIIDCYHFNDNISRMAGNFIVNEKDIYRPAQVCIKSYGDAVSLQRVKFVGGKWNFEEVRRIYSPNKDYDLGFHTFNVYKNVIVVDAVGYRKPRFCRLLRQMKNYIFNDTV